MTHSLKTVALHTIIGTIALFALAGTFFLPELHDALTYTNAHLGTAMTVVFYFSAAASFILTSLVACLMLEEPLWSSGVRFGEKVAGWISNTRNSLSSLFFGYVLVGAVNFFAVWGAWNVLR